MPAHHCRQLPYVLCNPLYCALRTHCQRALLALALAARRGRAAGRHASLAAKLLLRLSPTYYETRRALSHPAVVFWLRCCLQDIVPFKVLPPPKPRVIFVLGGPGAGKGTQCARMVREYGFVHLSAGDLLRDERDSGSPVGTLIEEYIREGKIVPVEVTVNLIKKAMAASGSSKFLVDGFPRNFDNLQGWQRVMGDSVCSQTVDATRAASLCSAAWRKRRSSITPLSALRPLSWCRPKWSASCSTTARRR